MGNTTQQKLLFYNNEEEIMNVYKKEDQWNI